jgi:hypothetical protein
MKAKILFFALISVSLVFFGCEKESDSGNTNGSVTQDSIPEVAGPKLTDKYATFRLEADISHLSQNQRGLVELLIHSGEIMDRMFWYDAYGDKKAFLDGIADPDQKRFAEINYGPWDRLDGNKPFIDGVGEKPKGANFYPSDMTKEEFEASELPNKSSLYTFLRRGDDGQLTTIWYHEQFAEEVEQVALMLEEAATMAEDEQFANYLTLRATALRTDEYQESDFAWMDMKNNLIDVVIGPIETYEDQLFGAKASHSTYVLLKDKSWSDRLSKYAAFLPELQKNLPVDAKYKKEKPGTDADLNAYDVIYYAGDCNAGSKTIAINLPNDEEVQLKKGTRRLQLKNAMQAKFDKILVPISEELITPDQRKHITFDAFFSNTMFHEVAHGLGIKNTINGKGTVREALKEHSSALEEGKADILGLYMVTQLHEKGELEGAIEDYYITFMASIFRSVRFGASSAHGKANMIRFSFFQEKGAFTRDEASGTYRVDIPKLKIAMTELSSLILSLQGEGDYDGVAKLVAEKGVIKPQLQADLDRLAAKQIPVDIVFEQGTTVLGL